MTSSNDLLKTLLFLLMTTGILGDPFHVPDQSEPGICNNVYSTHVSRRVPYTETYNKRRFLIWRVETRVNYRIEYEVGWKVMQECCKGYRDVLNKCQPVCDPDCTNGFCLKPNLCQCYPGYGMSDSKVCLPICTQACINGYCSAPNNCTCNSGYIQVNHGFCEPHCPSGLPNNSYCAEPDTVNCYRGYNKTETNDTIECQPICEKECINGQCVAPDKCACMEGYKPMAFDDFSCEPICEDTCVFGNCSAPNTCTCFEGYHPITASICNPICSKGCTNGRCVAPEVCSCDEGYLHENASYICEPMCTRDCINGECVAPDTCQCKEGYKHDQTNSVNGSWACQPSCTPDCGPHGTCIAPDTCSCSEGYQLTNETNVMVENGTSNSSAICAPVCNETCVNGECTEPDICSCYAGYEPIVNGSSSWCVPVCEEGCENGTCVRPNECQCWEGFVFSSNESNSSCISLCYRNCSNHGICANGQNECECGFGWGEDNCDEPTLCVTTLDSNDTDIRGIVGRNETNSTILDAKDSLPTCDQCMNFVDNETLCYNLLHDDQPPMVTCFISAEIPCSGLRNYDSLTQVGPHFNLIIAVLAALVLALSATATCLILRHIRKRRNVLDQKAENSNAADQLLPDESISNMEFHIE